MGGGELHISWIYSVRHSVGVACVDSLEAVPTVSTVHFKRVLKQAGNNVLLLIENSLFLNMYRDEDASEAMY